MQNLPPLVAGSDRWVLSIADRSAAALAECLLMADPRQSVGLLSEAIQSDPPLALWAVCANGFPSPPSGIEPVAQWLADNAARRLRWDGPAAIGVSRLEDAGWVQRMTQRVATAVETAALAEAIARQTEPDAAGEAYWLGLLHDPAGWLEVCGGEAKSVEPFLPAWLLDAQAVDCPAARCAGKAAALLLDPALNVDVPFRTECHRRAVRAGRRWRQTIPGAGRSLVALAERLGQLANLEQQFLETLEAEKLAAMAEFAAGAGHEINNPLAVIAGRAQLFLQDETDPERRRGLALINAQAKRVWEMIADMRLFARPPRPTFEPIDLAELADRLVEELSPEMAQQEVALSRGGHAGPLVIDADPVQLTVVLRAMCRNAVEAIGREGRVQIELVEADSEVEIRITDDGPGFDEQTRRHLFDPYYSARQAGRGLGLGLSKCWRIVVTNHHGRLDAQSRPGATVFTIRLPRRQEGGTTAGHE